MSFRKEKQIDWLISISPIILITILCIYFVIAPHAANQWIAKIRFYFTDTFGLYYLVIGLAVFSFRCTYPALLNMAILCLAVRQRNHGIHSLPGEQ